jgi:hypothetical protein
MALGTARHALPVLLFGLLAIIGLVAYCARDEKRLSFHREPPTIRIIHVVKRGFGLETEDAIIVTSAYFRTIKKQAFRSGMDAVVSVRAMPKAYFYRADEVAQSLESVKSQIKPAQVLGSWNAEGWYVFLPFRDEPLTFAGEGDGKPPQAVTDLFYSVEKFPVAKSRSEMIPNRCWGLCNKPEAVFEAPLMLP